MKTQIKIAIPERYKLQQLNAFDSFTSETTFAVLYKDGLPCLIDGNQEIIAIKFGVTMGINSNRFWDKNTKADSLYQIDILPEVQIS
jgi:hypothetical protein